MIAKTYITLHCTRYCYTQAELAIYSFITNIFCKPVRNLFLNFINLQEPYSTDIITMIKSNVFQFDVLISESKTFLHYYSILIT